MRRLTTVASVSEQPIGRPRRVVADLPSYRPGKGAAQAEAEHGISGAIKLASNENAAPPLPAIVEAVAAAANGANRYPDHRATEVREALAARLGVGPEQVAVGNGSTGVLQQLFFSFVDPGDGVVFPWRSFEVYPVFTRLMDGVAAQVPLAGDASEERRQGSRQDHEGGRPPLPSRRGDPFGAEAALHFDDGFDSRRRACHIEGHGADGQCTARQRLAVSISSTITSTS